METITEIKIGSSIYNKPMKDINPSPTINNSRNMKKFTSTKLSDSNSNITHSLFHNYSTPKLPIRSSLQKSFNNKNNFLLRLSLNKFSDSDKSNDITRAKEELSKNKKYTKIKIVKKDERKSVKRSSYIPLPEKQIKSPRTIFQRMIVNLDKLKIRTDKTLEVMRKNLRITRDEIKKRREQEREMQIMSSTYMQNIGEKKNKRKKNYLMNFKYKNNINNSLYITNYKNKSLSNIFPNISTNNNSNNINYNYNQSISNGSTTIINFVNDTATKSNNKTNNTNNINTSFNMNSANKTLNKKSFSQTTKNKNSPKKTKANNDSDSEEKINLFKIPEINLSSINSTRAIKPLFPIDKYKRAYKNMFHYRTLDFSLLYIRKQLYKIYGMPALLVEQTTFSKDNDLNTLSINNKICLIQDNIDHFKINIMYKNDFLEAFNNMESYQKAEFNCNLEETSCVLIKMIPIILQNYYEIVKKLVSIAIPNIKQERLKKPETESQCLNYNYSFFNSSTEYFNICLEVYRILNLKVNRFVYSIQDFGPLNSYLDILRYTTTNIISMSSSFISKTKNDKKILDKMEVGLGLKKAEVEEVDILERYHKRHRKQNSEWDLKIERVKRALDMKDGNMTKPEDYSDKRKYWSKFKIKGKHPGVKRSAFNNSIFRSMLKYFKPEIKSKIIALQIVDRFEMKKNEMNNIQEEDENNEDGNSRKIFA